MKQLHKKDNRKVKSILQSSKSQSFLGTKSIALGQHKANLERVLGLLFLFIELCYCRTEESHPKGIQMYFKKPQITVQKNHPLLTDSNFQLYLKLKQDRRRQVKKNPPTTEDNTGLLFYFHRITESFRSGKPLKLLYH